MHIANPIHKLVRFLNSEPIKAHITSPEAFHNFLQSLNLDQFKKLLIRINGIVRDTSIHKREFDGVNVAIRDFDNGSIIYSPPSLQDKEQLIGEMLSHVKKAPDLKTASLILYYGIQAIHPFKDGHTRTSNVLLALLQGVAHGKFELSKIAEANYRPSKDNFSLRLRNRSSLPKMTSLLEKVSSSMLLEQNLPEKFHGVTYLYVSGCDFLHHDDINNGKLTGETVNSLKYLLEENSENFNTNHLALIIFALKEFPELAVSMSDSSTIKFEATKLLDNLSAEQAQGLINTIDQVKANSIRCLFNLLNEADSIKKLIEDL